MALERLRDRPSVASGRALLLAMGALLVCDVIGGYLAVLRDDETWGTAWGFDTESTVPLPVGAVQLLLAWLAARDVRPPVGRRSALVLSVFCLLSVVMGALDGDLIGNIRDDGWLSVGVLWAFVLLVVTAAVGVLAWARASQLRIQADGTRD